MIKYSRRNAKAWWIASRSFYVLVPLVQIPISVWSGNHWAWLTWLFIAVFVALLVTAERSAFHHGYYFGQIMMMKIIEHQTSPEEFAEMPLPEPWDVPFSTKPEGT